MFKKSIFIAALVLTAAAAFNFAEAKPRHQVMSCDPSNAPGGVCVVDPSNIRDHRTPDASIRDHRTPEANIRDHRCPASQGGNCVGPEPQIVVPPPNRQPPGCGVAGCAPPPPPQSTECDPRVCDDFGQGRPHRPRPIIIIDPYDNGQYGITCGQGRNIVRNSGYRRVRVIDCSGRRFTYSGTRHGEVFGVVVNRRGRIVDVFGAP